MLVVPLILHVSFKKLQFQTIKENKACFARALDEASKICHLCSPWKYIECGANADFGAILGIIGGLLDELGCGYPGEPKTAASK